MKTKSSVMSKFFRTRILLVFVAFFLLFAMVVLRLFYLQVVSADELESKAKQQQMREVPVEAERGTIFDRNGNILGASISVDSVYASPTEISAEEAPEIAKTLAELLNLEEDAVYEKLTSGRAYEWIGRKIDEDTATKIRELDLPGIGLTTETKRSYPNGNLASHILGFVGVDNQGLAGIEAMMDDTLTGSDGYILAQYDSHGQEITGSNRSYVDPENGDSIVLTIDENIQYFCERELDQLMNGTVNPKGAAIVMMEAKTGELLALAVRPDYDPNAYGDYDSSTWRNTAISDFYEPGSTAKILTISAALEEGVVSEEDQFYDPGYISIGNLKIKCWSSTPHGSQSFVEVAENSCNPGFVEVGQRIDEDDNETFYRYLKAFGIGQETGLELPGESNGSLRDLSSQDEINPIDVANMYIGQGYGVTPIQLVTAVSAAVNGGTLMEPHLVKEIRDSNGNVKETVAPKEIRRVISEETSSRVCSILESVVANGTGNKAYIEGYRVGGKTGTAQKFIDGAYSKSKYVASFIGFAPADDPEIVCLVVIDEPGSYPIYGGTIAAPVFQKVVSDTLPYLGVEPQISSEEENDGDTTSIKEELETKTIAVPSVTGLSQEEAEKILNESGLTLRISGEGDIVSSQVPAPLTKVAKGDEVILTMGDDGADTVTIPNLKGKGILACSEIAEALGLVFVPEGSGIAVSQQPEAGTELKRGEVIKVVFENQDETEIETLSP